MKNNKHQKDKQFSFKIALLSLFILIISIIVISLVNL